MNEPESLEDRGAEVVIDALAYLKRAHPPQRHRQGGARVLPEESSQDALCEMEARGLQTGSGVVEDACKTLVAQRLKLSGTRWIPHGAQAILTMRGWDQSDRFDEAWALVAATYHSEIHVLANVIDLTPTPMRKPRARASR